MSTYKYAYVGDQPTVFTSLQNEDGTTWVPAKGEVIELSEPVAHPLLRLVTAAPVIEVDDVTDPEPDDVPDSDPVSEPAKNEEK